MSFLGYGLRDIRSGGKKNSCSRDSRGPRPLALGDGSRTGFHRRHRPLVCRFGNVGVPRFLAFGTETPRIQSSDGGELERPVVATRTLALSGEEDRISR